MLFFNELGVFTMANQHKQPKRFHNPAVDESDPSEEAQRERGRLRVKKSRQRQQAQGVSRIEILLDADYRALFDRLVEAKSQDFPVDLDQRRLLAKSKTAVFKEALTQTKTSFLTLTEQIARLKAEILALSPTFFKSDQDKQYPLPEAIAALPADPETLKPLLAQYYKASLVAQRQTKEAERLAKQYRELYETVDQENQRLREKCATKKP